MEALEVGCPRIHGVAATEELERYRTLIEGANVGVYLISDYKLVECNSALEKMLGWERGELVGRRITELIHPEDRGKVLNLMHERKTCTHNVRLIHRRGDVVCAELMMMPTTHRGMPATQGTLVQLSRAPDLDRVLEEEAERRLKFVEVLSHEMRTPLTILLGYIRLLKEGARDATLSRQLDHMLKSAERLLDSLNNILRMVELEQTQPTLTKESTDIADIVRRVAESMSPDAIGKQLSVQLELEPSVVVCDAYRIESVVEELLSNAIKYTPQGGSVRVRTSTSNGSVHIEVEDTGSGIAPKDMERIFDKFYIAHDVNSHARGLGIGLYLAKRIVELHGGRIWAESEVGRGSTFHVELPRAET